MTDVFHIPPFTTMEPLSTMAARVPCVAVTEAEPVPERELQLSRIGDHLHLRVGRSCAIFDANCVLSVEISSRRHAGKPFMAIHMSFRKDEDNVGYYLLTSPMTEAIWLEELANRISALLGLERETS